MNIIRILPLAVVFSLMLAALPALAQEEGPLTSELHAFRVTTAANGAESLTPTDEVEPGETVQYVLTYKNVSDEPLNQVKVDGPVPPEMVFIPDSSEQPANVVLHYSVDGGQTFSAPPVKYQKQLEDGTVVEAVATPDMYNRLRWTLPTIAPQSEIKLIYRVKVR